MEAEAAVFLLAELSIPVRTAVSSFRTTSCFYYKRTAKPSIRKRLQLAQTRIGCANKYISCANNISVVRIIYRLCE